MNRRGAVLYGVSPPHKDEPMISAAPTDENDDHNQQARRESIRYAITRAWRRTGRRCFTEAEIENAIDAVIARDRSAPPSREQTPSSSDAVQRDLIDHGCHAGRTRAAAAASAAGGSRKRREAAELAIAGAGRHGMTRHEAAAAVGCPVHAITAAVLQLLTAGRIIETSRKRLSPYGKPAAVLVSAILRDEA